MRSLAKLPRRRLPLRQRVSRWWLRLPKWRIRTTVLTLCVALVASVVTVLALSAEADGNANVQLGKTVSGASFTPDLSLGLSRDKDTALPGDKVTYALSVSNTGATLTLTGQLTATATPSAGATVLSWFDVVSTTNTAHCGAGGSDNGHDQWPELAGASGAAAGYTPEMPLAISGGIALTAVPVPASGVTYAGGADPVLGTMIGAGSTATWNYTAKITLSPDQVRFLLDPAQVTRMRNSFHLEVSPRPNSGQHALTDTDFCSQLAAANPSGTATGVQVSLSRPDGSVQQFTGATTPGLASMAPGAQVKLSGAYTVPVPGPKKPGEDDGAYLQRLTRLENAALTASVQLSATGSGGAISASAPAVTTVEHLPVVSIAKTGPASANAGFTANYPLKLADSGGAAASSIAVTDALPDGSTGTVTGTPSTLAAGAFATPSAAYAIPGQTPGGPLTDTAAVTWADANGNAYGPVSSSFTTDVISLYAGSTITLSPTNAGPDVTGAQSQALTATFLDQTAKPIANAALLFSVSGANAQQVSVTTAADGTATMTYTGAHDGTDGVQASFASGTLKVASNTASVGWVTPVSPASVGTSHCDFFTEAATAATFVAKPGDTATFGQDFPNIAFDPPAGVVPNNYTKVDTTTRPFTDVVTDLAGNAYGTIPAAGLGHQAGAGDMASFDASCTGTFTVAKPGDVTFSVNAASGFLLGVGGGATRVNGVFEGNPPLTVPFTGFATVGANAAARTNTAAQQVTVHFPTAGSFPFELDGFFISGAAAESLVLNTVSFTQQTSPLSVYVGYADGLRQGGSQFPYPWNGAPHVIYEGGCTGACQIDAGAIRLDNSGTTPVTVNHLTVQLANCTFDIWPKDVVLPPGGILIYTQMSTSIVVGCSNDGSFDTSDTIGYGNCANNGVIPQVTFTINGTTTSYADSGQILDTYGHDLAGCPFGTNESLPWTRIGGGGTAVNTPLPPAASLILSPGTTGGTVGIGQTYTVAAMDASGKPIPGLPVILNGYGAQTVTASGTTDAAGLAQIGVVPQAAGAETLQASGFVTGMRTLSNQAQATWTIQSAAPPPGGPPPNTNPPPSITAPGLPDGSVVVQPSPITAVIAPPAGQTITSWQTAYQSTRPGSSPVVIASGTGAPPTASAALQAARAKRATVAFAATVGGAASNLGTFDPTLLANGSYLILITATASGGGTLTQTSTITVDGVTKPGAFKTQVTDATVPVSGFTMSVERSYDSTDRASNGDFGHGWRVKLANFGTGSGAPLGQGGWVMYNTSCFLGLCNAAFRTTVPHVVTVTFPDGHDEEFDLVPVGALNLWAFPNATFVPHPGSATTSQLAPVGDPSLTYDHAGNLLAGAFSSGTGYCNPTQFQLTLPDQTKLILDVNAGLISATDPSGNKLTVDGSGVHASSGPSLTFTRDASNRISQITGPGGLKLAYGYDASGNLKTVTDADNTVIDTYGYDATSLLTSYKDAAGSPAAVMVYDTSGRLIQVTDSAGNTTKIANDIAGHTDAVTSADGKIVTVTTSDDRGRPVSVNRVYGGANHVTGFVYNSLDQVVSRTDSNGKTATATYDAAGNLTSYSDPSGRGVSVTYDAANRPVTYTPPGQGAYTYSYDATGNVTSVSGPTPTQSYTYDSAGHMLSLTDGTNGPNGNPRQWSYSWDAAGRMASSTDPDGNTTTYTRDAAGRVTAITDALGGITKYAYDPVGHMLSTTDADNRTTSYTYDADYRLTKTTDPTGASTSRTYDSAGNTATTTDALGNVTSYTYDAMNREASSTDPLKQVTKLAYDGAGHLASRTDPLGRTMTYGYDADGRQTSLTDATGAVTATGYDEAGRMISSTNALGKVTTTSYDAVGRVAQVTDPLGRVTKYGYDAAGNQTSVTDPLNRVTKSVFDAAGRLLSTTDPAGGVTAFGYDAAGNRTSVTDPLNRVSTTAYDADNRPVAQTDPAKDTVSTAYDAAGQIVAMTTAAGIKTTEAYDAAGRLTAVTDAAGHTIATAYDAAGRVTAATDPNGHATTFAYDADGRRTSMKDAAGGTVSFGYDAAGQRTSVTDADGHTTNYGFDAAGRPASVTDPLGRKSVTAYDAAGRVTAVTDARNITSTRAYDAAGQVTGISTPDGPVTFGYDAAGQQTSMTDPTGTVTTGHDAAGRVTSQTSAAGTLAYTYDAAGQRTAMSQLAGTIAYSYDPAGRLATMSDWNKATTNYAWNPDGKLLSITRPNGVVTTNTYDAVGRLTGITDQNSGGTVLGQENYTLDAVGNRTAVATLAGTTSYTLDQLNRLTGATGPGGTYAYTYDAAGNRTSATSPAGTTSYRYDAAGQLTSSSGAGSASYTYDAAGDLTGDGTSTYSWDWNHRLTGATSAGTTHRYTYAADDVRASADGTALLTDRLGGVPQVVQAGGAALAWGPGGGLAEQQNGASTLFALTDAGGSTAGLTDGTGASVGSTVYDPFGAPTATGQSALAGYTGALGGPGGLLDLGARWYSPGLGRFVSADSVQPGAPGTQGWNPYSYAADNPTTFTDPTGHQVALEYEKLAQTLVYLGITAVTLEWLIVFNGLKQIEQAIDDTGTDTGPVDEKKPDPKPCSDAQPCPFPPPPCLFGIGPLCQKKQNDKCEAQAAAWATRVPGLESDAEAVNLLEFQNNKDYAWQQTVVAMDVCVVSSGDIEEYIAAGETQLTRQQRAMAAGFGAIPKAGPSDHAERVAIAGAKADVAKFGNLRPIAIYSTNPFCGPPTAKAPNRKDCLSWIQTSEGATVLPPVFPQRRARVAYWWPQRVVWS